VPRPPARGDLTGRAPRPTPPPGLPRGAPQDPRNDLTQDSPPGDPGKVPSTPTTRYPRETSRTSSISVRRGSTGAGVGARTLSARSARSRNQRLRGPSRPSPESPRTPRGASSERCHEVTLSKNDQARALFRDSTPCLVSVGASIGRHDRCPAQSRQWPTLVALRRHIRPARVRHGRRSTSTNSPVQRAAGCLLVAIVRFGHLMQSARWMRRRRPRR
jgi:hypothetical protein